MCVAVVVTAVAVPVAVNAEANDPMAGEKVADVVVVVDVAVGVAEACAV